jgi:hypothetical protein
MSEQSGLSADIVAVGKMMLWEYGNQDELNTPGHLKEKISLCWLSRTLRQLEAVEILVRGGYHADGWISFRSLLERYLLYTHLCAMNEFEVFDDWCFKQRHEGAMRVKSNAMLQTKPEVMQHKFSENETERYRRVLADERVRKWKRPKMEEVSRRVEMKFLYDAGYDFASGYVHPVADDGNDDYFILMNRPHEIHDDNTPQILVRNAQLVTTLHMQEFMNQPGLNWRRVVYDLIDAIRHKIGGETIDYSVTLQKVVYLHLSPAGLCEKGVAGMSKLT